MKTIVMYIQFNIGILLVALMFPACSYGVESIVFSDTSDTESSCDDWATLRRGEYEINNNIWGRGKIKKYYQCVYSGENTGNRFLANAGWSWNWPKSIDGVKAYPSILYGRKPWNKYSTTPQLPQAIGQIQKLSVSYRVKTQSQGAVNLLLESWITKTNMPVPTDRIGELAIHLYQNSWPGQAGHFVRSIDIDDLPFDFYLEKSIRAPGDRHTWAYYGFVHKGPPLMQGKLDMMHFVNFLVRHGYINSHDYVATVELGNEIDHGKGRTLIEQFAVQVDSKRQGPPEY